MPGVSHFWSSLLGYRHLGLKLFVSCPLWMGYIAPLQNKDRGRKESSVQISHHSADALQDARWQLSHLWYQKDYVSSCIKWHLPGFPLSVICSRVFSNKFTPFLLLCSESQQTIFLRLLQITSGTKSFLWLQRSQVLLESTFICCTFISHQSPASGFWHQLLLLFQHYEQYGFLSWPSGMLPHALCGFWALPSPLKQFSILISLC